MLKPGECYKIIEGHLPFSFEIGNKLNLFSRENCTTNIKPGIIFTVIDSIIGNKEFRDLYKYNFKVLLENRLLWLCFDEDSIIHNNLKNWIEKI